MPHDIAEIFDNASFLPGDAEAAQSSATKNYLIVFTPRSGSSWLGETLTRTKHMGRPNEWINPEFLPGILANFCRCGPAQYISQLQERFVSPIGVFGMQATPGQLALFSKYADISWLFSEFSIIYLTRRDLGAQAVSLYKATETGYFHATQEKTKTIEEKLRSVEYDGAKISRWATHILNQEQWAETNFAAYGVKPLRIEYEDLTRGPDVVINRIARFVGVRDLNLDRLPSTPHRKIADGKSNSLTARFLQDYPALCAR